MKYIFLLLFFVPTLCLAGNIPGKPLAQKGTLIFSDDFEREDLGEWKTIIPAFAVKDGVLKGWQAKDDHGAVGRIYRPMKDVIVEFKFKLEGSKQFNVVFDDKNYKGSHAGHILRVRPWLDCQGESRTRRMARCGHRNCRRPDACEL